MKKKPSKCPQVEIMELEEEIIRLRNQIARMSKGALLVFGCFWNGGWYSAGDEGE
jgi:hypothetical protein